MALQRSDRAPSKRTNEAQQCVLHRYPFMGIHSKSISIQDYCKCISHGFWIAVLDEINFEMHSHFTDDAVRTASFGHGWNPTFMTPHIASHQALWMQHTTTSRQTSGAWHRPAGVTLASWMAKGLGQRCDYEVAPPEASIAHQFVHVGP